MAGRGRSLVVPGYGQTGRNPPAFGGGCLAAGGAATRIKTDRNGSTRIRFDLPHLSFTQLSSCDSAA
jgi:hypothetical protein